MNPYILPTILGVIIIALTFIAWAIQYERNELQKRFNKAKKEYDEGWDERTKQLVEAQRQLATEMNRANELEEREKKHNERVNQIRSELTALEKQFDENNKAAYDVEEAYAKAKNIIKHQNAMLEKQSKTIDKLTFKLKHPKKSNGQFKSKYPQQDQD